MAVSDEGQGETFSKLIVSQCCKIATFKVRGKGCNQLIVLSAQKVTFTRFVRCFCFRSYETGLRPFQTLSIFLWTHALCAAKYLGEITQGGESQQLRDL